MTEMRTWAHFSMGLCLSSAGTYHDLSHSQLIGQLVALERELVIRREEEVANEGASRRRIRGWAEGQQEQGDIEAYGDASQYFPSLGDGGWLPLDLISAVHRCNSSATSSGSTLVRSQASDHCGFLVATPLVIPVGCFLDVSSLPRNTLEKNGMVGQISC
jgi:hypothetical protein